MDLYYTLALSFGLCCVGLVGDLEAGAPASVESSLKYHSAHAGALTETRDPGPEQRQAGSLTGAVAS